MLLAYTVIVTLALIPIITGSFSSLTRPSTAPASASGPEENDTLVNQLTSSDALWLPVIASCSLTGLYLLITYLSLDWVTVLLRSYILFTGFLSTTHALATLLSHCSERVTNWPKYTLTAARKTGSKENLSDLNISSLHLVTGFIALYLSIYYAVSNNWVVANILGMCFSFNAIKLMALDRLRTGMILLSGLFLYDIYFVFGTNIMVEVATGMDIPNKLICPRDLLHNSHGSVTMLGLGDIVVPGVYIALILRFDLSQHHKQRPEEQYRKNWFAFAKPYFMISLIAYVLALCTTITIMHIFKAAQPALLYLSPALMASTLLTAWHRDELYALWDYKERAAEQESTLPNEPSKEK